MAGGAGGAAQGALGMMGTGAMIGSVIPGVGNVAGAVVGLVVGAIGGAMFGGQPQTTYLTDLNIPTSKYGTGVTQVFGNCRVTGNVMWSGTAQAQMEQVTKK